MNKVFRQLKREEILLMWEVRLHRRWTFVISQEYGNEARHALNTQDRTRVMDKKYSRYFWRAVSGQTGWAKMVKHMLGAIRDTSVSQVESR